LVLVELGILEGGDNRGEEFREARLVQLLKSGARNTDREVFAFVERIHPNGGLNLGREGYFGIFAWLLEPREGLGILPDVHAVHLVELGDAVVDHRRVEVFSTEVRISGSGLGRKKKKKKKK